MIKKLSSGFAGAQTRSFSGLDREVEVRLGVKDDSTFPRKEPGADLSPAEKLDARIQQLISKEAHAKTN